MEQIVYKMKRETLKKVLLTIHAMGIKILDENLQSLLKSSLAKDS